MLIYKNDKMTNDLPISLKKFYARSDNLTDEIKRRFRRSANLNVPFVLNEFRPKVFFYLLNETFKKKNSKMPNSRIKIYIFIIFIIIFIILTILLYLSYHIFPIFQLYFLHINIFI